MDAPGAASDPCSRMCVRPRRAPQPPCSRTSATCSPFRASCRSVVWRLLRCLIAGSGCPGAPAGSFGSALFYQDRTASRCEMRADPKQARPLGDRKSTLRFHAYRQQKLRFRTTSLLHRGMTRATWRHQCPASCSPSYATAVSRLRSRYSSPLRARRRTRPIPVRLAGLPPLWREVPGRCHADRIAVASSVVAVVRSMQCSLSPERYLLALRCCKINDALSQLRAK